ncbi:insulin-like peptide [Patiria miniata]|uniref:Insulin-like domain-containing protein n=1 Tax=Patiria miniata TaxID=46514 RepID=A0A913ZB12_PATMI|nr:insulin-like peptide [Patiria miniata]
MWISNLSTMRALLLIDVIFVVLAGPISAWQKICGEQLVETVSVVCSTRGFYSHRVEKREAELFQDERTAKSFLSSHIGSRQRRRTGRIATECCEKVCSFDIVESYCNPWPVVEDRDDPMLLAPVAPGRVRQDKSADADELLLMQEAAAGEQFAEENSLLRQEEELIDALETLENKNAEGENVVLQQPEEFEEVEEMTEPETEREELEEEFPFPEVIPTKKRRRVEGRRSRENSRDRSGKSEGRSRKKSGSREGDRSSRRRGKSSRRKKGRDGRERSKRWEGLVTSHPPTKEIVDALRSALRAAGRTPSLFAPANNFLLDEQRSPQATPTGLQHRSALDLSSGKAGRSYRVTQKDNQSTLEALYNLAVRLSRPRRG